MDSAGYYPLGVNPAATYFNKRILRRNTLNNLIPADNPSPLSSFAGKLLLLALAYFAFGRLGLAIPYVGTHITLIWLPTGIAVAALLRWGYRYWPGIFLGALLTNFTLDAHLLLAISIALGNTLSPLLTVWLLHRLEIP